MTGYSLDQNKPTLGRIIDNNVRHFVIFLNVNPKMRQLASFPDYEFAAGTT